MLFAFVGLWLALGSWAGDHARAVPAAPTEFSLRQPNGDVFLAQRFGDEWYNGVETARGHTILRDRTGEWEFAQRALDGTLSPSGAVVGEDPPPAPKHLRDPEEAAAGEELQEGSEPATESPAIELFGTDEIPSQAPSLGADKTLVILAQFQDQASLGTSASQWSSKFFGATDSVKDFYEEASYDQFSLSPAAETEGTANDGVIGWVTLPMNHPNSTEIGAANRAVTKAAIQAADPHINYAAFDTNGDGVVRNTELHVTVIAAGQEASCCTGKVVWGHRWGLADPAVVDAKSIGGWGYTQFGEMHGDHMATLGIMVHEFGHDLEWPDLYDSDQTSPKTSDGIGRWSVMASGSWSYAPGDMYYGQTPPHPDAWSKWFKGWISPQTVSGTESKQVNAAASATNANVAVRLLENPGGPDDWSWLGTGSGEYFLVENRQKLAGTYDESLPGSGMLILHVNEAAGDNANDSARLVDIEEADGLNELDTYGGDTGDSGDVYPGTSINRTFDGASSPNSNLIGGAASGVGVTSISDSSTSMTATFTELGGTGPAPLNDDFSDATTIEGTSFTSTVDNAAATIEAGESAQAGCPLGRTVWYKYVPTRDTRVRANTQSSSFDTVLNVWRGATLAGLTGIGCNDDASGTALWSSVPEFVATAGETYYFQAGGYYNSTAQTVAAGDLTFEFAARPVNDDFSTVQLVTGTSGTSDGSNEGATKEIGEPSHAGNTGGASVWYRWIAPATGHYTFDTEGSAPGLDTLLGVYTGGAVNGLTLVGQNDDFVGLKGKSLVQFDGVQGTEYKIAVDGYAYTGEAAGQGSVKLNWSYLAPSADLSLDKTVVREGNQLIYTVTAANDGPDAASDVVVTDTLPGKVTHLSSFTTEGACTGIATVTCTIGTIGNGEDEVVTIVTSLTDVGLIENTALVTSTTNDPDAANNSDAADVTVEPAPLTDLSVSMEALKDPAGPQFTFRAVVTRADANDDEDKVVLDVLLPSSVRADAHPEGCSPIIGGLSCEIGTVAVGSPETLDFVVTPATPGPHIAGATIGGTNVDPNPGNDSAGATAAPLLVCDNVFTAFNDKVVGTTAPDVLCGGEGNDSINGGGGDDLIFGGDGTDTVSYAGSPHAMTVDLRVQDATLPGAKPTLASTAGHGNDRFTGIERAVGSSKSDTLHGHATFGDKLSGGAGSDLIYGYGGVDTLIGGRGGDSIFGGKGADFLNGSRGFDLCRGRSDSRTSCEA